MQQKCRGLAITRRGSVDETRIEPSAVAGECLISSAGVGIITAGGSTAGWQEEKSPHALQRSGVAASFVVVAVFSERSQAGKWPTPSGHLARI